jgi:hypothetical protein
MPLFKEPTFDAKADADRARARISGRLGRHNVQPSNYVIPIVGAILAIVFTIYALTRPSVKDHLDAPRAPRTLEVELE